MLRVVCGPLAIAALAFLALPTSSGLAREGAEPRMAEGFASLSGPGAIGVLRPLQPGPRPESMLPLHVQPVEIRGPAGMLVAIETAEGWSQLGPSPLRIGLVVGQAYSLRIGGLPGREGDELFP